MTYNCVELLISYDLGIYKRQTLSNVDGKYEFLRDNLIRHNDCCSRFCIITPPLPIILVTNHEGINIFNAIKP